MSNDGGGWSCAQRCWGLGLAVGVIAAFLLMVAGDHGLLTAIFGCIVISIIVGVLLQWVACQPAKVSPEATHVDPGHMAAPGPARTPTSSDPEQVETPAELPASPEPDVVEPETASAALDAQDQAPLVKPSKQLAGEAELAARKGKWKFEGGTTRHTSGPSPVAVAPATTAMESPQRLEMARAGEPDDLKQIKGVGPKLEKLLHSMGFFHFDQIAAWTEEEVAWVDNNLEGFKGRVSRDNWVDQARMLAAGDTSESLGDVNKGDVS